MYTVLVHCKYRNMAKTNSLQYTVPKGILEGEMFLCMNGNVYCVYWKIFINSNFLTWCAKNYCNDNKYFSSNFSSRVWKYFAPNLQ